MARTPMDPALARLVLTAGEGLRRAPTAVQAAAVLRRWLMGRGLERDRWGNYLVDAAHRYHFRAQTMDYQTHAEGGWRNSRAYPLIDTALELLANAAEDARDAAARERYVGLQGRRRGEAGQRVVAAKARDTKALRERYAQKYAAAELEPSALLAWGRHYLATAQRTGETIRLGPPLGPLVADSRARLEAALAAGATLPEDDQSFVSTRRPPLLPLYLPDLDYRWIETEGGVDYTVRVAHHERGRATLTLGRAGAGHLGVDPYTRRLGAVHGTAHDVGDGYVSGRVWDDGESVGGAIFYIGAHDTRRGAGRRLVRLFCRLMAGYGVGYWLVESAGEEGLPFFQKLGREGWLEIEPLEDSRDLRARCAPLAHPDQLALPWLGA